MQVLYLITQYGQMSRPEIKWYEIVLGKEGTEEAIKLVSLEIFEGCLGKD